MKKTFVKDVYSVKFSTIKVGEHFMTGGDDIYIAISDSVNDSHKKCFNSVSIEDGNVYHFFNNDNVFRVTIEEIVITAPHMI